MHKKSCSIINGEPVSFVNSKFLNIIGFIIKNKYLGSARKFVINTVSREIALQDTEKFHIFIVKTNWPKLLRNPESQSEMQIDFKDKNIHSTIIGGAIDFFVLQDNSLEITLLGNPQNKAIPSDHKLAKEIIEGIIKESHLNEHYKISINIQP